MAEITQAYIRQLAIKFGCPVSEDDVLVFLNQEGHAYGMWMRMMEAAEDFVISNLPKVLSKTGASQSNEPTVRPDNGYFRIYVTGADSQSGQITH